MIGTTATAVTGAPASPLDGINVNGTLYFTSHAQPGKLFSTNPSVTTTTVVKTGLDFSFANDRPAFAALGSSLIPSPTRM